MRSRDPFGAALASLRAALEEGLAPGQRLPVGDVATALGLSASPVREALSRLCGEGLIEDRRGLGYFTRSAPVEDIIGLLQLEEALVQLARREATNQTPGGVSDAAVEAWIDDLMIRCESQPLVESYGRVRDRLSPLRRLNGATDHKAEFQEKDAVRAYYQRWRATAAALASRLRRLDSAPVEYRGNRV